MPDSHKTYYGISLGDVSLGLPSPNTYGSDAGYILSPDQPPWSRPTATIWPFLSGCVPAVRRAKGLAFLRAFTDDSAAQTGDRRLFMAGYLNRADVWARFSEAFDEERRASPAIEYLKMSEANSLQGQFEGWSNTQRDEKIAALARVIRHFKPFSFQFSVDRGQYDRLVRPNSPYGFSDPHFVACFGVMSGLTRFAADQGIKTPIEFIFDQQDGTDDNVDLFFENLLAALPRASRRLISGKPLFRDDKEMLPLQAADMLAWHVRREHELGQSLPLMDFLRRSGAHLISELPPEMMQKWQHHMNQLPGISLVQSKNQWRKIKPVLRRLSALGFAAPYGSPWKNALFYARLYFKGLFGR
jgi:hypothetical protein